ncbi:MAG: hypothetical protein OXE53_19555 [Deltaproteobacteria bacterium]|nr:hypothetical protein [Deltaproteobacteria bacterium]
MDHSTQYFDIPAVSWCYGSRIGIGREDVHVLKRDMAVLKLAFAPAVLALLVKLVFFP